MSASAWKSIASFDGSKATSSPACDRLGNGEPSRGKRDPANRVIGGRLVAPGFAGLQPHGQIVDRGRRLERARHLAEGAEQDGGRSVRVNVLRLLVDAFDRPELLVGRQGEPELESAGPAGVAGTAAMPCAAGGLEPFDPAGGQEPGGAGRVFIADAALPKVSERRDARMRMPPEA